MRVGFLTLLLLAAAVLCAAQARPQRKTARPPSPAQQAAKQQFQEDQKAISELQQRDIAANIAFDVNELMSLWADDGVLLLPGRAPIVGRDALRRYYEEEKQKLGNSDILAYEENWEEVQVSGDLASQWGTITERTRPPVGGNEITTTLHVLRVLKRQPDGLWLIARAMWNAAPAPSTPKPAPPPK